MNRKISNLKRDWGLDMTRKYGLNSSTEPEDFKSIIVHIMNMGGVTPREADEFMSIADDPVEFEELKQELL